MVEESKGAVLAAMAVNFAIAVGKLVAGILGGSASLLAEAGHSVADTVNQVFLLVGINLSDTVADDRHPHGYGKEGFFWSFLAAIFIFVAGAAFSFYEGIRTLVQDVHGVRSGFELVLAYAVLGMALLFESISFIVAVRGVVSGARRRGWSLVRYLRESPETTIKTVFFEDSAAIVGLLCAAAGLTLSELTHNEAWDAVGSLAIGLVLGATALLLGLQSRDLLLGAAAEPEVRKEIEDLVCGFPEVDHMVRLLTMRMGAHSILVTGEIEVRRGLNTAEIEDLLRRIDALLAERLPHVRDTFWELRSREAPA